jgi:hypothetical protein
LLKPVFAFEGHQGGTTLLDYLNKLQHAARRIARLGRAIEEATEMAPESMRQVIAALLALRGVKQMTAVTSPRRGEAVDSCWVRSSSSGLLPRGGAGGDPSRMAHAAARADSNAWTQAR